jgi:putative ABC transport system ATP-binding protein
MLLSPNSGEIVLNGKCLSDEKQKNWTKIRRKQIGFIFQNHQLLPYLTVEDQLKLVKNMIKKFLLM